MATITAEDVERHRLWRAREPSGARLSRVCADLRGADLRRADLYEADLRDAYLREANLFGANLREADLRRADLFGAKSVLHPPVNDPRGYRCVAVWHTDEWRISAGCRWFTLAAALAHWGPAYRGDRAIGNAYLHALDWLARQPTPSEAGPAQEVA